MLILSLPDNTLRMLVELQGLLRDSTCILEAEPGKLYSKVTNLLFYLSVYKLVHSSN